MADDEAEGPQETEKDWLGALLPPEEQLALRDEAQGPDGTSYTDLDAEMIDNPGAEEAGVASTADETEEEELDVQLHEAISLPPEGAEGAGDRDQAGGVLDVGLYGELDAREEGYVADQEGQEEGPAEDPALLLTERLPELGANDENEGPLASEAAGLPWLQAEETTAEAPRVDPPWLDQVLCDDLPLRSLDTRGSWGVAAGQRVVFFRQDTRQDGPELSAPATSVVLIETADEPVCLLATMAGQLYRVTPTSCRPVPNVGECFARPPSSFRRGLRVTRSARRDDDLALVAGDGDLVAVAGGGARCQPLLSRSGDEQVIVLGQPGPPLLALVQERDRFCLRSSPDGASAFEDQPLPPVAELVARDPAPLLTARGRMVALASRNLGLLLSRDAGAHFEPVPHASHVSALTSDDREEPTVYVARESPSGEHQEILRIAPGASQLECIAVIEADHDSPVQALRWQEASSRLLLAGPFGLRQLRAPG